MPPSLFQGGFSFLQNGGGDEQYTEVEMSQMSIPEAIGREPGEKILRDQARIPHSANTSDAMTTGKIGWWFAVLTALCSMGYGLAVIAVLVSSLTSQSSSPAAGWSGINAFLTSFQPVQMLPVIPSLLLAPAFTGLMVTVYSYAAEDKKIWGLLGLAFTLIYAAMAAINYMVQLLPVWRSISGGETDGLAMFVLGNPHSIFWGLAYAYIFMNLGMMFSAQVFTGDPLKKRIRLLFLLNGASGVITIGSALLDSPPFYLIGSLVVWCPIFTAAAVSTARLFKITGRAGILT
jgi:hypothetical protein